jgi:hypothetical protein
MYSMPQAQKQGNLHPHLELQHWPLTLETGSAMAQYRLVRPAPQCIEANAITTQTVTIGVRGR